MLEAPPPPSGGPACVGATGSAPAPPRCPRAGRRVEEGPEGARGEAVERLRAAWKRARLARPPLEGPTTAPRAPCRWPGAARGAPQQPWPGRACGGAKRWSRSSAPQPPPPAPRAARELSRRPRGRCGACQLVVLSVRKHGAREDTVNKLRGDHEEHASVLCSAPLCSRRRIRMPAEAEAEPN